MKRKKEKISRAGSKSLTAADVANPQHTHAPPPCVFSPSASGVVCLLDQSLRPADVCSPPTRTHTHHPMWMCFRCSPSTSGVVLSSQFRRRQSLDRRELSLRRRRLRWIDCRRRTHFSHMAHPTFPISHILICVFEFRPPTHFSHMSHPTVPISLPYLSHISQFSSCLLQAATKALDAAGAIVEAKLSRFLCPIANSLYVTPIRICHTWRVP